MDLAVISADPGDYTAVLNLLFQGFAADDRAAAVQQAQRSLASGELDPRGLLAARARRQLVGAMLSIASSGAVGLVWPPQTLPMHIQPSVEDALIGATHEYLRKHRAKLAQALLQAREASLGVPLVRNGYRHITRLFYHRRWLDDLAATDLVQPTSLTFRAFAEVDRGLFTATLRQTYVGTLDCPEVEGIRTIDDVVAGYQAQAGHDPQRWWVAFAGADPAGVVLANASREEPAWDLVYIGIVPEQRGRGLGRLLVRHVLIEARMAGMRVVTLCVDSRNAPALRLYQHLGFAIWDEREAYLATL